MNSSRLHRIPAVLGWAFITGVLMLPVGELAAQMPPPTDNSRISISVDDAADVIVVNESGQRTGYDVVTQNRLEEIPNSVYFRDALDDDVTGAPADAVSHFVAIAPSAPGVYSIRAEGVKLGKFHLALRVYGIDAKRQAKVDFNGIASPGTISQFEIRTDTVSGALPKVVRVATFGSALDDVRNCRAIGLIDNAGISNSLLSKLEAARDRSGTARANVLSAFKSEVEAQTNKHIASYASQLLLQDANALLGLVS